jgi:large subunit ribosomal protein L36e
MTSHGIAIGLKSLRGYQVTKIQKVKKAPKKHTKNLLVKDVIREITGLAPYEKRVQEFIKNGLDKRALRLASRRVCLPVFLLACIDLLAWFLPKRKEKTRRIGCPVEK